jgi:hypothetical protein
VLVVGELSIHPCGDDWIGGSVGSTIYGATTTSSPCTNDHIFESLIISTCY